MNKKTYRVQHKDGTLERNFERRIDAKRLRKALGSIQSIEEIVKEFDKEFPKKPWSEVGVWVSADGFSGEIKTRREWIHTFLHHALTSAIQVERKRIIKLLPKESEIPSYDQASVSYTAGWNDYRREALKAITQE